MPVKPLTAETLLGVGPVITVSIGDGEIVDRPAVQEMVDAELRAIFADLVQRAGVNAKRSLILTFAFTPRPDQQGRLVDVSLDVEVASKSPKQAMPSIVLGKEGAGLFYRVDSIDARQRNLADALEDEHAAAIPMPRAGTA